jgi:hypothetical protein
MHSHHLRREVDRIRLINAIIARHINVLALKANKMIDDTFALHNQKVIQELRKEWVWDMAVNPFMKPQV